MYQAVQCLASSARNKVIRCHLNFTCFTDYSVCLSHCLLQWRIQDFWKGGRAGEWPNDLRWSSAGCPLRGFCLALYSILYLYQEIVGILFIGAPYIVPFFISCWHNLNCWSRSFEVIWSCLLSLMLVSCFTFIDDFTVVWISHVNGAIYACQTVLKHRYRHVNLLLTLSSCFL